MFQGKTQTAAISAGRVTPAPDLVRCPCGASTVLARDICDRAKCSCDDLRSVLTIAGKDAAELVCIALFIAGVLAVGLVFGGGA